MFEARAVSSNQKGMLPDLDAVVRRNLENEYLRPPALHTRTAFAIVKDWFCGDNLILDSGCGQGESTYNIAKKFPQARVLGVDKSAARLALGPVLPLNAKIIRADLVDLWGLMAQAGIKLQYHFILYPNPWPKKTHLRRRWHGHPAWRWLLQLGGQLELRTNWEIYAQEFARALEISQYPRPELRSLQTSSPITQFERKYSLARQNLYLLKTSLK